MLHSSRDVSLTHLSSGDLKIGIDPSTATIASLSVRGHSLLVGGQGYLAVEDRTTGKFHFKPGETSAEFEQQGDGIFFRQRDETADITLTQRWSAREDGVEWSVEVSTGRASTREIHLHFVVPVFGPGSHGFTAHARCPMVPGTGNDHMMVVYSPDMWNEESFHCSVLPMVSSYDPDTDAGIAIVQPADMPKPRMEFFFVREQPDISMVVRWTHLRLTAGHTTKARMLLVPIRGCWRDALRVVRDMHPDYFKVHEQSVFAMDGPTASAPIIARDGVDRLVDKQGLSWLSIHARVFSRFGEYAPEEESWPSWVSHWRLEHFDLERLSRTEFRWLRYMVPNNSLWKEETIARQTLNDYIARVRAKGVGVLLYANPVIASIDSTDNYPGSLATNAEGTPLFRDYHRTVPLNPASDTSWGKHLDAMTRRQLEIFPEIDGIFLDELHYNQFDFAHDDGISARGGRNVAMLGFAVQDAARRICEIVHEQGKVVWSNGTNTLEVARYVDGLMAEVSSEWLGSMLYLSLEKPLSLLFGKGPWTVEQLESDLGVALFAGAQPSVLHDSTCVVPSVAPELLAVRDRYMPLFRMLRGRKWILHPHAISTDGGLLVNCFALPDGDFAVTVSCSKRKGEISEDTARVALRLCWPGLENVHWAAFMSASAPDQPTHLEIRREQDVVYLDIPGGESGIVRLSVSAADAEEVRR